MLAVLILPACATYRKSEGLRLKLNPEMASRCPDRVDRAKVGSLTGTVLGALIGFCCTVVIELTGGKGVGAALLNMAVFGAVISYTMVMLSYIKLRISRPNLLRPYRSPLGIPGAALGAVLSIVALFATFSVEDYRSAVIGVAVFLAVGIVYFLLYSRHRLVAQAPEEENALIVDAEKQLTHQ